MAFEHIPVMLDQVIEMLKPREGGVFLDGTLGGGGHSQALLARGAAVYGVDRDSDALAAATQRLRAFLFFMQFTEISMIYRRLQKRTAFRR